MAYLKFLEVHAVCYYCGGELHCECIAGNINTINDRFEVYTVKVAPCHKGCAATPHKGSRRTHRPTRASRCRK